MSNDDYGKWRTKTSSRLSITVDRQRLHMTYGHCRPGRARHYHLVLGDDREYQECICVASMDLTRPLYLITDSWNITKNRRIERTASSTS